MYNWEAQSEGGMFVFQGINGKIANGCETE